jgi:hypothetical protein
MSRPEQVQQGSPLFDHLVGGGEQSVGHGEAERRRKARRAAPLVSHEYRQFCVAQDVACCAAKDQLPQSTLCVRSLDYQVTA